MVIDYFCYSDCGGREVNEDSVGSYEDNGFWAFTLCDGLGGHGMGDAASNAAAEAMITCAAQKRFCKSILDECFESANAAVLSKQGEKSVRNGMKTTATLLVLSNYIASWGHIGDSRIYYFHKNKFVKRTVDHSVPQMLALSGEIKEKEIRFHPDRNRLLRCLPWEGKKYEIDQTDQQIYSGDSFILMSDGFWELVEEKAMEKSLKKTTTAKQAAQKMIDVAIQNGENKNMDNLSVIVIKIY